MKATVPIGVRRAATGAPDRHGNPSTGHAPAVEVLVFAVYPVSANELQPGRTDVTSLLTVLAPLGVVIGPQDLVVYRGEDFEVDGEIGDWSDGPFSFEPGLSFNIKRTEG